jgi:hypothetical protein
MRDLAARPVVKGEMSAALTERLAEPYLRWCNPCQATHTYEQPSGSRCAKRVPEHLDVVRAMLRLLGPATPKLGRRVRRQPGPRREGPLARGRGAGRGRRRRPRRAGRELVVPDADARKDLWRTLGRPGGVLVGHELVGSWRPRSKGKRLQVAVTVWGGGDIANGVAEQAERLAAFRGQAFAGFSED